MAFPRILLALMVLVFAPSARAQQALPTTYPALLAAAAGYVQTLPRSPGDPVDPKQTIWRLTGNALEIRQDDGTILRAPAQVIGVWSEPQQAFRWAWQFADAPAPLIAQSLRVRAYGQAHGIAELTGERAPATRQEARERFAVALTIIGAPGLFTGYRSNGTVELMAIGQTQVLMPNATAPVAAPIPAPVQPGIIVTPQVVPAPQVMPAPQVAPLPAPSTTGPVPGIVLDQPLTQPQPGILLPPGGTQ